MEALRRGQAALERAAREAEARAQRAIAEARRLGEETHGGGGGEAKSRAANPEAGQGGEAAQEALRQEARRAELRCAELTSRLTEWRARCPLAESKLETLTQELEASRGEARELQRRWQHLALRHSAGSPSRSPRRGSGHPALRSPDFQAIEAGPIPREPR